MAGMYSKLD
jgi:NADPH:quinone reductase